jgi:hypothetical protein
MTLPPFDANAPAPRSASLRLQNVDASRGGDWWRQAWHVFRQRPFGFTSVFAAFATLALLLQAVPLVGTVVMLVALPLLSLGYMIATESHVRGSPTHPLHVTLAMLKSSTKRNALFALSALYAVTMLLVLLASDWVDQGMFQQMMLLMSKPRTAANQAEMVTVAASAAFNNGLLLRFGGAGLLSIPFWHAPALVWWGGQGAMQALFSSAIGIWKTKGAFSLYLGMFAALILGAGVAVGTLLSIIGLGSMMGMIATAMGLMFTVLFYVSLWFGFDDTYGVSQATDMATKAS